MLPSAMAATCPIAVGASSTRMAAAVAMPARGRSGQRVLAMLHTAWATIATATSFRPCSSPAPAREAERLAAPDANTTSSAAEGSFKPAQAASPPVQPARIRPSANPVWLDAGPGRNWHSPTTSA